MGPHVPLSIVRASEVVVWSSHVPLRRSAVSVRKVRISVTFLQLLYAHLNFTMLGNDGDSLLKVLGSGQGSAV